ncbi:MAG: hypothetical protein WA003_15945 [Desulfuromonadaceae bacterium]
MQSYEPTDRNSIQGRHPDKSAPHDEVHGFRRSGKCCGCVATVYVLIRGDLFHFAFRKKGAATVKVVVMEQKSAEAIVDRTPPLMAVWWLETSPVSRDGLTLSKGRT